MAHDDGEQDLVSLRSASEHRPNVRAADTIALLQLPDVVKCMRCSDLVRMTKKQLKQYKNETGLDLLYDMPCHYSLGNSSCPAQSVNIANYVDHKHVVSVYMDAFESNDASRLSSVLARIRTKDAVTEKLIMEKINQAMQQRFSKQDAVSSVPTPKDNSAELEEVVNEVPVNTEQKSSQ